jgi:hypothetical protein
MKKVYDGERSQSLYLPPGYSVRSAEIRNIKLESIVDQIWGSSSPIAIKETPHFKYLNGDKNPLREYFEFCRGHTWARKGTPHEDMTVDYLLEQFDEVVNSDKDYLEPPYESYYIIVQSNWHCVDGLRRACTLLANGVQEAPVAWVS